MGRSEFPQSRRRQDALRSDLDRLPPDHSDGTAVMLVRVYSGGSIPTTAPKVFLCHPVTVAVSESENAAPTFTADTSTTLAVTVLGPGVPVAGDLLLARMVGSRWVAEHKSTCPAGTPRVCAAVTTCGTGGALGYAGTPVTITGPGGYTASGTTNVVGRFCTPSTDTIVPGTYTVSADDGTFSGSTTVTVGSDCRDYYGTLCLCPMKVCIDVAGCRSLPLSGATVTVTQGGFSTSYTSDGTQHCIVLPATAQFTVTITKARFQTYTVTYPPPAFVRACTTFGISATLLPAAGYVCGPCSIQCPDPIKKTLLLTDSFLGITATVTYDDTHGWWIGSAYYDYPGCHTPYGATCAAYGGLPVTFVWSGGCGETVAWPADLGNFCPNGDIPDRLFGVNLLGTLYPPAPGYNPTITCPPAFSYTVDLIVPATETGTSPRASIYAPGGSSCGPAGTTTWTVTEAP